MKTANTRIDYLDAMRGIAAMMVLTGHYIGWRYGDKIILKILSFPFNANDAVSFFFVLSGFVLSYAYLQDKTKEIPVNKFYINRIFRLFPGFIIALITGWGYYNRYDLTFTNFVRVFIQDKTQFWEEFFLLRGVNNIYLPGWTLSIELGASFLMPYFIVVARYNRALVLPFAIATLLAANITGFFLFHFLLGIFVAAYYNDFLSAKFKETLLYKNRFIILPIAILLFSMRKIEVFWPLGHTLKYILNYLRLDTFVFTGIASALFLIYTIHFEKAKLFFRNPVLLFYGKISYGIYLMHWVLVSAFFDYYEKLLRYIGNPKVLFIGGFFAIIILATAMATLLYYFIEQPAVKIGKRITAKMQSKWVIKAE